MANAAPAKPGSSQKKKKKPRTVLDLVVQRLYSTQEWLARFQKQLGPSDDEDGSPLNTTRLTAGLAHDALVELGRSLPALRSSGWKPASTTIAVGDTVQVKPKRIGRFLEGGAFSALQVARLHVTSVHGKYAKLTTSDGESIGLYPLSYFKLAPAVLSK